MKKERVIKIKPSLNQLQKIKYICEAMEEITKVVDQPTVVDDLEDVDNRYYKICEIVSDLNQKVGD